MGIVNDVTNIMNTSQTQEQGESCKNLNHVKIYMIPNKICKETKIKSSVKKTKQSKESPFHLSQKKSEDTVKQPILSVYYVWTGYFRTTLYPNKE